MKANIENADMRKLEYNSRQCACAAMRSWFMRCLRQVDTGQSGSILRVLQDRAMIEGETDLALTPKKERRSSCS
jgi:hypothetical protein